MDVITSLDELHKYKKPYVIAMGTFDGLHVGHMQVINAAKDEARQSGCKLAVFTFSNHPLTLIAPDKAPLALLSERQKIDLLGSLGVDVLIDIPFTREFADIEPLDFLQRLSAVGYTCLVVGDNFTYGRFGKGNTESLRYASKLIGFKLLVLSLANINGVTISSTIIRRFVLEGQVEKAAAMLGRWYSLTGIVSHGKERGRGLGFPTANLELEDLKVAVPKYGVYAVRVLFKGKVYGGMANIGRNPTFGDIPVARLETNIFGFDQNIYGEKITVEFISYIRNEMAFSSIDVLIRQLFEDSKRCKSEIADKCT